MHKRAFLLAFAPFALSATGCASIFKGDNSSMRIIGLHANDKVTALDGTEIVHDGETVKLPAKTKPDHVRLTVKTERGYFAVNPHRYVAANWATYDVLGGIFTLFLPVLVDGFTENWHEYDDVRLPKGPGGPFKPDAPSTATGPAATTAPQPAPPAPESEPRACFDARDYAKRASGASGKERAMLLELSERKASECRQLRGEEILRVNSRC